MTRRAAATATIAAAAIAAASLTGASAQDQQRPDLGAMLIQGLESTEGCLGVDAGQFKSGKNAIIAWFENKAAAIRWYNSRTHMGAMHMAMGEQAATMKHDPLSHVDDPTIPIMVIASITFQNEPAIEGMNLPISQIAIELYTPLPGGAYITSRLAPDSLDVPHMKAYTPDGKPGDED